MKRTILLCAFILTSILTFSQWNYFSQYGLLPENILDEIIGESSGEQAFNHMLEMSAYNRARPLNEYATTLMESDYVIQKLKSYGIEGNIERFGKTKSWKGIKGKLWEVSPNKRKIVDYDDMPLFLASGSLDANVTAELIWVGSGSKSDLENLDLTGKICLTSGSLGNLAAMVAKGAEGVITFQNSRALKDPLQIPTSGIWTRGKKLEKGFAFKITARQGWKLRDRLLRKEKIKVHAEVVAITVELDIQVPTCFIPGTDPDAEEIILCAHIFEGYVKQGANDNISGSAALLDVARVLQTLYTEGRVERPKRGIRFIWVPEFSGTIPWVKAHPELMAKTLCNINMDMVGLRLLENQSFMNLQRTTMGNPHYINDVVESYMRYVGENNKSRLTLVSRHGFLKPIVAPTGTDDPFTYNIEMNNGASDHSVFNAWSVGVPGIMLITWPDPNYHTSHDRPEACDPTQLKRVVFLTAASAYTIALADDQIATKIATEIFGNSMHRMGHQLSISNNAIADANAANLAAIYKKETSKIDAIFMNEKETMATVAELGSPALKKYLNAQTKRIEDIYKGNLKVTEEQMMMTSSMLSIPAVKLKLTDLEKKAQKLIPVPTDIVRGGYGAYRKPLTNLSKEIKERYPYKSLKRSSGELRLLCNGKHNALEIKKMIEAQYPYDLEMQDVLNYLALLKEAGLVEYK